MDGVIDVVVGVMDSIMSEVVEVEIVELDIVRLL